MANLKNLEIKIWTGATNGASAPSAAGKILFDQTSRRIGINGEWYQTSAGHDFENLEAVITGLQNAGYIKESEEAGVYVVDTVNGATSAYQFYQTLLTEIQGVSGWTYADISDLKADVAGVSGMVVAASAGVTANAASIKGVSGWASAGISGLKVDVAGVSGMVVEASARITANATSIAGVSGTAYKNKQDIEGVSGTAYKNKQDIEGVSGWASEGIATNATAIAKLGATFAQHVLENQQAIAGVSGMVVAASAGVTANAASIKGVSGWASAGISGLKVDVAGVSGMVVEASARITANATSIAGVSGTAYANKTAIAGVSGTAYANKIAIEGVSGAIASLQNDSAVTLWHGGTDITGQSVIADGTEYTLKQGDAEVAKFNIEKDSFVKEGTVKYCPADTAEGEHDTPVANEKDAPEGIYNTPFIKLTIKTSDGATTEKYIYIKAVSLVDVYTGTTGVNIDVAVSSDNKISASLHIAGATQSSNIGVPGTTGEAITGSTGTYQLEYINVSKDVTVSTENGSVSGVSAVASAVDASGNAKKAYNAAKDYTDQEVGQVISWIVESGS